MIIILLNIISLYYGKKNVVKNKAFFLDNTLIIELDYRSLPTGRRLDTVYSICLDGEEKKTKWYTREHDMDLVFFEQKDFLIIKFNDLDFFPTSIVFDLEKSDYFYIYLDNDELDEIEVRTKYTFFR